MNMSGNSSNSVTNTNNNGWINNFGWGSSWGSGCNCRKPSCRTCFPVRSCYCQKPGCGICFPQKSCGAVNNKPCGCGKPTCGKCFQIGFPPGYPLYNPQFNSQFCPQFNPQFSPQVNPRLNPQFNNFGSPECFPRRRVVTWKINYLTANQLNVAANLDLQLVGPWGIVLVDNQLFVADNHTDMITNYDLNGNKLAGNAPTRNSVHNAGFPTGIAVNYFGNFNVTDGSVSRAALLLIAGETGTIHGYSPQVNPVKTYVLISQSMGTGKTTVYRGIACTDKYIYAADFYRKVIDVFDSSYLLVTGFPFVDGDTTNPIPSNYGQTNIVLINDYLYVLYAQQNPAVNGDDTPGPGHGYISIFNLDGTFVRRFTSQGVLNSPWAFIKAPCECGFPKNSFLVGNYGDGFINIFDCNGSFCGRLLNAAGLPIIIPGLWGLTTHYKCVNELFFTASPDQDVNGIMGSLLVDQLISC